MLSLKHQQGSVLLWVILVMMLTLQLMTHLLQVMVDLQSSISNWQHIQQTQKKLLKKLVDWSEFDFHWQDLGKYQCIVICQPDCKGTHHGLVRLTMNGVILLIRVARPVDELRCDHESPIKLSHSILYYRFLRS